MILEKASFGDSECLMVVAVSTRLKHGLRGTQPSFVG